MIYLTHEEGCAPVYQTKNAACADVVAKEDTVIPSIRFQQDGAGALCNCTMPPVVMVPTGLRIQAVDSAGMVGGFVPELQLRARSGLSADGLLLATGVGTIDCDYRDEILVPLINLSGREITIQKGERIAQLTLGLRARLMSASVVDVEREGGFGSTGKGSSGIIVP